MTYIIPIYSLSSCYDIEKNFIPNDIIYVHNAEEVIEKKQIVVHPLALNYIYQKKFRCNKHSCCVWLITFVFCTILFIIIFVGSPKLK